MIDHPAVARAEVITGLVREMLPHVTDAPAVCPGCDRKLAWEATRPWKIRCRHCRADVVDPDRQQP